MDSATARVTVSLAILDTSELNISTCRMSNDGDSFRAGTPYLYIYVENKQTLPSVQSSVKFQDFYKNLNDRI